MVNKILHALDWRTQKVRQNLEGLSSFPWMGILAAPLSRQDNIEIPRISTVGLRPGATGGPQTKLLEFRRLVRDSKNPNVLFATSGSPPPVRGLKLAKVFGIKVLLNQNGVFYPAVSRNWEKTNAQLRAVHSQADFVVYQSEFSKAAYAQWVGPVCSRHIVLWNGVDINTFSPAPHADRSDSTLRILITGALAVENSYQLRPLEKLLEELSLASRFGGDFDRVIVRYRGKVHPEYDSFLANLNKRYSAQHPRVCFELGGGFSRAEAPEVYRWADLYLHLKTKDNCPNTVAEAMASGLPVLAPRSGGTPELVGECGLLFPVSETWEQPSVVDAEPFARAIVGTVSKQWLKAKSESARKRAVQEFDLTRWVQRHVEIAAELVKEKR